MDNEDMNGEKKESVGPIWEKIKIITSILATIAVPVVVLLVGKSIESSIKERELSVKYIELAVSVLKDEPTPETNNLRQWSIDIINKYASIRLSNDAVKELENKALPSSNSKFEIDNGALVSKGELSLSLKKSGGSSRCFFMWWNKVEGAEYYNVSRTNEKGRIDSLINTKNTSVQIVSNWYKPDLSQTFKPDSYCGGPETEVLDPFHTLFHSDSDSLSIYKVTAFGVNNRELQSATMHIDSPDHGG